MEKIVAIDAAEIGPIMKYLGLDGLIAIAKRGDHFFYSDDFEEELRRSGFLETRNGELFEDWINDQRNPPSGYMPDVNIVGVDDVLEGEKDTYDPNRKRLTKRGGFETWDMSIRKRMATNPQFDYEVISREREFYRNKNRKIYDPVAGENAKIVDVPFRYTSMKKLMAEMVVNPDLNLSEEQFMNIERKWDTGFGEVKGLNQGTLVFPRTYQEAQRQRALRAGRQGEIFGINGQADGQLGRAHIDPDTSVPFSPSGAPLDGLSAGQPESSPGIGGKAKGSLHEGPSIGRRFMNLARKGTPVAVLGIAAVPVLSMVRARAAERNIPFGQAARELGLEFGEEEFKGLMAEVGADAAITAIPVAGLLKKAWDVLGNIDDIIAVTQLYGAAYPENETIQQMAGIATAIEGSEAFGLYVDGRDALTGAVGGAIDWVFGTSEDEAELDERLGSLRTAIEQDAGTLVQAAGEGASTERLAGEIISRAEAHRAAIAAARPDGEVASGLTGPQTAAETGQRVLDDGAAVPREKPAGLGSDAVTAGPDGPVIEGDRAVPLAKPGAERRGLDAPVRKSSYDRYQRLGRSPEEEAEALAEYWEMLRESYLEMDGHKEAAEEFAVWKFKQKWALSAFAPEAEGTVLKYPVETAYPDFEEDGHGYVRQEAEAILRDNGIRAARWYLTPNERTGRDKAQADEDEDGYGPRMTLSYEDETGQQHHVSDHFQANAGAARERRWQARYGAGRLQTGGKGGERAPAAAPESPRLENAPVPAPKPAFQTAQRPGQKPVPGPVSKPVREPLMPGVAKPRAKPDPAQL